MSKHGKRFAAQLSTLEIHHEDWEDDEKVVIGKFNLGDRHAIEGRAFDLHAKMVGSGASEGVGTAVNIEALQMETLMRGIRSWTFTDHAGKVVPITKHGIASLNPEDGAWIFDQINKFNQPPYTVEDLKENENLLYEEENKEKPNAVIISSIQANIEEIKEALAAKREKFPDVGDSA